jgi:hypothetical protein
MGKQVGQCHMVDSTFIFNYPNVSNLNEFGSSTNTLSLDLQGLQPNDHAAIRTKINNAANLRVWSVDSDSTTSTVTVDQQGNGTIINGSLAGNARAGITVAISTCCPPAMPWPICMQPTSRNLILLGPPLTGN